MPFPKLQPMPLAMSSGTTDVVSVTHDDLGREVLSTHSFQEKLPDAEMFDLDVLLKNKVPLEEVSPRMFGRDKLVIRKSSKKDTSDEPVETETQIQAQDKE